MPASVKDVAALANVSSSTVSNFLNHPHLLGEATRERVRAAIAELGFVPNESARQLRAGTGKLLAVSLIDAWQPYFAELSEAYFGTNDFYPFVRAELKEHDPRGYALMEKAWSVKK